ncbi:hypothetical protein ACJ72_08070 [Emergomyces africanus]|uniref:Phospholipase/carboxylesterase/thioesterase domain-containing protein n=1 Tax=Emergomyces africanus TaxID=1955775 RepID=A0A1B7NLB9_9EURO|nr:hypothetical protein ACJ72_08070 [Emergomyces africanus]
MPSNKRTYSEPLAIPPFSTTEHTHTFILLHGRGSNAERFGIEFLRAADLSARLPTVKFVFPTASKRRSTVLKKIPINQWFDNYSLEDPGERTELQIDGLCQTATFLRSLIESEAKKFASQENDGYKRIILGGLSQGCAAGIFTFLAGGLGEDNSNEMEFRDRKLVGGFVGMSGWLPFNKQLEDIFQSSRDAVDEDTYNPFAQSPPPSTDDGSVNDDGESTELQAINHIRDILDLPMLPSLPTHNFQSPVFLGHGSADEKVSVNLGQSMVDFLQKRLDMDVTWKVYDGFGHWYKVPDEIDDIVHFLEKKVGVPVSKGLDLELNSQTQGIHSR